MSDGDAADTLLDGSLDDVLDTAGEYGRALIAATSVTESERNPVGIVLYAEGFVADDCAAMDTMFCDELMGEPERPGLWIWEGAHRIEPGETCSWEGTWREATPMELALFQEGLSPFREVASG